jgi:hypothetical protein
MDDDVLRWLAIQNEAVVLRVQNPSLRRGQALFNALYAMHPGLAGKISGTAADPFYDDSREWAFSVAVRKHFGNDTL